MSGFQPTSIADSSATAAPFGTAPPAPVLSPEELRRVADDVLHWSAADAVSVFIDHSAIGMTRVARGRVRMQQSGTTLMLRVGTAFGHRAWGYLAADQLDERTLRRAVAYLDSISRESSGDPRPRVIPIPPRPYLPGTVWQPTTADAFAEARHAAVFDLVGPVIDAGLIPAAMVGTYAASKVHVERRGIAAMGWETDAEIAVTGWHPNARGSGWAGQAARVWTALQPAVVAARAIEITRLAVNPVAVEPGRRTAILDRPAVATLVNAMAETFDAVLNMIGQTPLQDPATRKPRLGQRVMDPRITLVSDPHDPDGGYLPFDGEGYPRVPMTWIDQGVLTNLAYRTDFAAQRGYPKPNTITRSMRMTGSTTSSTPPPTVEEMIARCEEGIYVNRLGYIEPVRGDPYSGTMTGVTSGGCFLIRDGKIIKAVKDFWFRDSPWIALNARLEAIGSSQRAAFGYAPWSGEWPIEPVIVPPLMIRDFNFSALSDAV